jgi:hypothetical protein
VMSRIRNISLIIAVAICGFSAIQTAGAATRGVSRAQAIQAIRGYAPALRTAGLECIRPGGSLTNWFCDSTAFHASIARQKNGRLMVGVICKRAGTTPKSGCR